MSWHRVLLGLVVSVIFVTLLLRQVALSELRDAFSDAQFGWLVAGFAIYLGALWLRGLRWRLMLRESTVLSTNDATALVIIGYAANNVLPVRVGELVRAQLLSDRHGADRLSALGTIVAERILDGLVLSLFLAGTIALAGGNETLRLLAMAMGTGFVVLTVGLFLLGPWLVSEPAKGLQLLKFAPKRVREFMESRASRFVYGLATVRERSAWAAVLGITIASWTVEAAMYWLVGIGFGLELSPLLFLGVCGAANLAIAVPSTSGGIGPFEFFAREVVVVFGVTTVAGTAYALALHALLLIPIVILGLMLLWQRHISFRSLLRPLPKVEAGSREDVATLNSERLRGTD